MLSSLEREQPPDTTICHIFAPGEAAQEDDFSAGPMFADSRGLVRRTWVIVMTQCLSRHQYVESVWDQTLATWLGSQRHAVKWLGVSPARGVHRQRQVRHHQGLHSRSRIATLRLLRKLKLSH